MVSPQGYSYGKDPKADNPFWTDDEVKEEITATASVDNSTGTPSVDVTKNGYNFNFAFKNLKGEKGDTGPAGKDGSDANIDRAVTGISITNTNGTYGISETKGDGSITNVGNIEVPNIDNVIAEVNDSIVENQTAGYDHHTIKETEHNGVQNDVGSFYIARKQITALNTDGSFKTVDQTGKEETGKISPEPELQAYVERTEGSFTYGYPFTAVQTVQGIGKDDTVVVTFSSILNNILTHKRSNSSNARYSPNPLRNGWTQEITIANLQDYPQFIMPYVGEALNTTSHINHTFFGASDYSIQSPVLVLNVTVVLNSDGSATFTTRLGGFYMNKVTNEVLELGQEDDPASYPLLKFTKKVK